MTHWKRPWFWEGLGAGGEGDNRGWGGWMASPTQWAWVWVNSGSWWWTGRASVLWFMGWQRVRHDWATELKWAPSWFNENILTNLLVSVLSLLLFSDHAYFKMSLFCFYYFYFLLRWHFWTLVLEKTFESPLDCQEIKPVNPKGNQSWIFIGRTVAEAETPTFLPPDVKN